MSRTESSPSENFRDLKVLFLSLLLIAIMVVGLGTAYIYYIGPRGFVIHPYQEPDVELGDPVTLDDDVSSVSIEVVKATPKWSIKSFSTLLVFKESHEVLVSTNDISEGVYATSHGVTMEFVDHNHNGKLDVRDLFILRGLPRKEALKFYVLSEASGNALAWQQIVL